MFELKASLRTIQEMWVWLREQCPLGFWTAQGYTKVYIYDEDLAVVFKLAWSEYIINVTEN